MQRRPLGHPNPTLGHRQQHHPAVRGDSRAVERGGDFLALDGWKREQRNRIVDHGGHGRRQCASSHS
jgi:hypothetical protein